MPKQISYQYQPIGPAADDHRNYNRYLEQQHLSDMEYEFMIGHLNRMLRDLQHSIEQEADEESSK